MSVNTLWDFVLKGGAVRWTYIYSGGETYSVEREWKLVCSWDGGSGAHYLYDPFQQVRQSLLADLSLPAGDDEPFHAELLVDNILWGWACEQEDTFRRQGPGRWPW